MIEVVESTDFFSGQAQALAARDDRPHWLSALQAQAWSTFKELGWPTKRDEAWRFTPIKPITKASYRVARDGEADVSHLILEDQSLVLVFVNGTFRADLSRLENLPEGVTLEPLSSAVMGPNDEAVCAHLGKIAKTDAFGALNLALCQEGVYLQVADGTALDRLVEIIHFNTENEGTISNQMRHLIVAGEKSKLSVVETFAGPATAVFSNTATELVVGREADVAHYFRDTTQESTWHIHALAGRLMANSKLACHTLLTGGALIRNSLHLRFEGEGAQASTDGLFVGHGSQVHDNHVYVDHAVGHNQSEQFFKGILDDTARGVYTGRVVVRPDAQKTDSRQTNRNLLLSDKAKIDTQPQLEIYADDVKCAHGATTGQMDDDALFYMQARGIDPDRARVLLLYAFAHEVLDRIPLESLRKAAEAFLLERFAAKGILGDPS